jgi:hypothetical protein
MQRKVANHCISLTSAKGEGGVFSELMQSAGKSVEWLNAVWKPFLRFFRGAVGRHRDFDFASTAFLPAVFLVISMMIICYWIGARNSGGLASLLLWISYEPLWTVCLLVVAVLVALLLSIMLLFVGNRALLGLWSMLPLKRDANSEIPLVDRVGILDAFRKVRSHIATSSGTLARPQGFLTRLFWPSSAVEAPAIHLESEDAACFFFEAYDRLQGIESRSKDIVVLARRLATGTDPKGESDSLPVDEDRVRLSPDADTVGEAIEKMLDGLRPDFRLQHERLVQDVRVTQTEIRDAVLSIDEKVTAGLVQVAGRKAVDDLLDEFQKASRGLALELAQVFGVGRRTVGLGALGSIPGPKTHANSLAFNLEWTTLGVWSHWGPVARYNWATGTVRTDRELLEIAETERLEIERLREIVKSSSRGDIVSGASRSWPEAGDGLVDEYVTSLEAAEQAQRELDRREEARLRRAIRLERLQGARSQILAYVTSASFVVLVALGISVASFQGFYEPTDRGQVVAAFWSALIVVIAMFVSAAVFVRPIVNHAFYVCLLENRLRFDDGARSPLGTPNFDWEPGQPKAGRRQGAFVVGVMVFIALFLGQQGVAHLGGLDYRLVAVSKQSLNQGDGITQRNAGDLVELEWRRCDPTWARYRLIDPVELRDTFVVGGCETPHTVFARPDLIVRADVSEWSWRGQSSGEPECATQSDGRRAADSGDAGISRGGITELPKGICGTTINKVTQKPAMPTPNAPPVSIRDEVVELRKVLVAMDPTSSLRGISEAVRQLAERNSHDSGREFSDIRIEARNITVGALDANSGMTVYLDRQQIAQPSQLYVIYQGTAEEARQATWLGSVGFNFNCSDDSSEHCKPKHACMKEESAIEQGHDRKLKEIISRAESALQHKNGNLVVVGWTDPSGNSEFNKGLGKQRADYIAARLSSRIAGAPIHTIGVGAGSPPAPPARPCDGQRRRVDVYLIDAKPAVAVASP